MNAEYSVPHTTSLTFSDFITHEIPTIDTVPTPDTRIYWISGDKWDALTIAIKMLNESMNGDSDQLLSNARLNLESIHLPGIFVLDQTDSESPYSILYDSSQYDVTLVVGEVSKKYPLDPPDRELVISKKLNIIK